MLRQSLRKVLLEFLGFSVAAATATILGFWISAITGSNFLGILGASEIVVFEVLLMLGTSRWLKRRRRNSAIG